MGDVGNFLFGGSQENQSGQNSSQQSSSSQNSSQQQSNQASGSVSNNSQVSGSQSGNQAYGPLAAALTPALGYVTGAGSAMASLLGLPQSTFHYTAPPSSAPPLLPPTPASSSSSSGLSDLLTLLAGSSAPAPAPAPSPSPAPSPTPVPVPVPVPTPAPSGPPVGLPRLPPPQSYAAPLPVATPVERRAMGGPVAANQPVIVGENQPEMFVPHTSGTIVPSVPGMGPSNPAWRDSIMSRLNGRFGGGPTGMFPPVATPGGGTTGGPIPGTPAPVPTPLPPTPAPVPTSTPASASTGLNDWSNSAGLNFILDQGQKAISGASAANGTFNSGATGKALETYGTNLGSTYLNDYMNHLMQYAQLGLGSASALGGAGGTSISQSVGSGGSTSGSIGSSSGSSQGSSTGSGSSTGTTSGTSDSKKGLVPDILG